MKNDIYTHKHTRMSLLHVQAREPHIRLQRPEDSLRLNFPFRLRVPIGQQLHDVSRGHVISKKSGLFAQVRMKLVGDMFGEEPRGGMSVRMPAEQKVSIWIWHSEQNARGSDMLCGCD